jgi:hypothetical protein
VLLYSGRKPRAAKYYPDTFNALRKMIISGGTDVVGTVFTQAHHHQLTPSQRQRPGRTTILRPQVTRRWHHLQNHASGTDVSITRNYPSSWSSQCLFNTTTYLSSTRPPSSWTHCCVCYEPMDDRVALPLPPYVLLPVSLHDRCQPATENCAKCRTPLSDRYPVSSKRSYKDRHLHRWSSKRFESSPSCGGRRCQDQRRTRRLR